MRINQEEAVNTSKVSNGEIKHPQKERESFIQYLHRLLCISYEELISPFLEYLNKHSNFSDGLQRSIRNNLLMGDSLKKLSSIDFSLASRGPKIDFIHEVEEKLGLHQSENIFDDFPTFYESNTEPIIDEIDRLSEITAKSLEFQSDANLNMIKIASEIKVASDKAVYSSKRNWKLSIGILVISIISLFLGAYGIISSNNSNALNSTIMINELQNIGSSISSQSDLRIIYESKLNDMQSNIDSLEMKLEKSLKALEDKNGEKGK